MEKKNGLLYASSSLGLVRSFSKSRYEELEMARLRSAEDPRVTPSHAPTICLLVMWKFADKMA